MTVEQIEIVRHLRAKRIG